MPMVNALDTTTTSTTKKRQLPVKQRQKMGMQKIYDEKNDY